MNFLFIYPPGRGFRLADKKIIPVTPFSPPLGILYLSTILENEGHNIEILDFTAENVNESTLKNKISNADAVGVSIAHHSLVQATSLTQYIREYDKDIPIVIGGPYCTLLPEESLINFKADICIPGEGEPVISLVTKYLGRNEKLKDIPGIYYKENETIKKTGPFQIIKELDKIAFPARHLVEKYDYGYFGGSKLMKGKTTSIITTRGCPYRCSFCGFNAIYPKYQERSIDNVIREFSEIADAGYRSVVIADNNFLANAKRVEKIMDELLKRNFSMDIWILGVRVDSANRILWEKMRDAGVKFLSFGIESGNQKVLDFYNKQTTVDQIRKAVNLSNEMGFITSGSFIIGAPIETEEDILDNIAFAKTLHLDVAHFLVLHYVYGSRLWKDAVKKGLISPDEYGFYANSNRGLGNFSEEELRRFCKMAYRSYYINPKYIFRKIHKVIKTRQLQLIKIGMKLLIPR